MAKATICYNLRKKYNHMLGTGVWIQIINFYLLMIYKFGVFYEKIRFIYK